MREPRRAGDRWDTQPPSPDPGHRATAAVHAMAVRAWTWGTRGAVLASYFYPSDGLFFHQRPPFDPRYRPPVYGGGDAAGAARLQSRWDISSGGDPEAGGAWVLRDAG